MPDDRRPRILAADDDAANRRVLERHLARHAVDVAVVGSGPEALERLAAEPFDLVLLDGMMPGMDGPSTAREIRRREVNGPGGHIPVVALTASALPEDRHRMLAAGMDDVVAKPLEPEELGGALARWLPSDGAGRTSVIGPVTPTTHGVLVDPAAVARLARLGDRAFVERIVRLFLADAAGQVGQIDAAVAIGDEALAAAALESLSSIAGLLGAVALARRTDDALAGDARAGAGLGPLLEATSTRLSELLAHAAGAPGG